MARPSKGEEAKRHIITMRMSTQSRDRIKDVAEANGRSITQEIESRLERSFDREDALGGAQTAALLRSLAAAISQIETATGGKWHDDYAAWHATKEAIPALVVEIMQRQKPLPPNAEKIEAAIAEKRRLQEAGEYIEREGKSTLELLIEAGSGQLNTTEAAASVEQQIGEALAPALAEIERGGKAARQIVQSALEQLQWP